MHDENPFFLRNPWQYDPSSSAKPRPDASLGFATRALHAGTETRLLLGYSMGAAVAMHLAAALQPERLVLISPFWRAPHGQDEPDSNPSAKIKPGGPRTSSVTRPTSS